MVDLTGLDGALYVITFCFNSLISSFGKTFVSIIYFTIIICALSTIFGLGVSLVSSVSHRKRSIDAANETRAYRDSQKQYHSAKTDFYKSKSAYYKSRTKGGKS